MKPLATWLAGYDYNPRRAECLYLAQTMLRQEGKYRISHAIGLMAKRIPFPTDDILFVQSNVYQLDIDYELSVTAYAGRRFAPRLRVLPPLALA